MSGISGTVSATVAVVALYVGWAAFDTEKKNNVLDYTIKKFGAFEAGYPCGSNEVQNIRFFMNVVNLLRPEETPGRSLPPSRCRYVSAWGPPHSSNPPPLSPNASPDVSEADADNTSQLRIEIADGTPETKILAPPQHVPIPRPRPKNIPRLKS
jgi:hypothetical protein